MLAIAVVTPLRAFAQTPPPAAPAPAAATAEATPPAPMPLPPPPPPPVEAPPPAVVVATPAPAAAPAAPAPKLTWGGLVDTYYMYYFNPPSGSTSLLPPTSMAAGRVFDTNANSFTLALAKVSLNASMDPVSFQLDVGYGSVPTVVNGGSMGTQPPGIFVEQAYGEIALPGNLTIDFGKFVTTAGAEVIEANKNWLYSRSLLFGIIPFVHVGARANLKVSDQLTLQASLVNNWGGLGDPDNNAWKTVGVSATATISPLVTLIATGYFGKEATQGATGSTPGDLTILADVVAAFTLSDKLGLNVNFDYINAPVTTSDSSDHQVGVSVMGHYSVSDHLSLAARGEFLQNHFGGVSVNQEEVTVNVGVPVGKNFELRPEVRADFSGDPIFSGEKNMVTGTVAALTYF